jgi:mycarose O-acyltransferase
MHLCRRKTTLRSIYHRPTCPFGARFGRIAEFKYTGGVSTVTQLVTHAEVDTKRPTGLPSLTGLRFLAAFSVFGLHLTSENIFAAPVIRDQMFAFFWQAGAAGVSYFFILSGFVLTWSARPSDRPTAFWRRRFFKIYPNQLVTMGAAAIILAWVTRQALDGRVAVLSALLLQSYSPSLAVRAAFNPVAWSLSCEMLFYLTFPLLLHWIRRIRPEQLWVWVGVMVALIVAFAAAAGKLPTQHVYPIVGLTDWQTWLVYQFPPARLPEFVLGILLARIVMTGGRLPFGRRGATLSVLAAGVLLPLFPGTYRAVAVMVLPLGLLVAASAVADTEGRPSWLAGRLMVRLGELSFAFYLWHYLVVEAVHQWLGGPTRSWQTPEGLAVSVLIFVIALALSWLLYTFVERPVMRRFAVPRRRKPLVVN